MYEKKTMNILWIINSLRLSENVQKKYLKKKLFRCKLIN